MKAEQVLEEVTEQVAVCTKCSLYHSRKKAVPGEGPADSEILFIGEGPGFYENEQGRPFVGAAGQFLEELLGSIGLKRNDVFITNVVKCRPPGNRDPEPGEIETCTGNYLNRQIEAINPKMIVTLGRFSMGLFLPGVKISSVHGRPFKQSGRVIVPMFHPAAALHQPSLRDSVIADFKKLPGFIAQMQKVEVEAKPEPPKGNGDPGQENTGPTQLSLF
ncbi:MAG: uracil-DNA glycosylase [Anaerolineaceae bacterium]|nr:uracil-DNA glycosylase [Anaerolineaceae bacterium]